jgi:UDP-glucuronate 4-epimerase
VGKVILVTGGAGFIGSHLASALVKRDHHVVVVDSLNEYYSVDLKEYRAEELKKDKNVSFFNINLVNENEVFRLFEKFKFDTVFHLAAQAGVRLPAIESKKYLDANLVGFMNVLTAVRIHEPKNFIFASSSSVYGNCPVVPFNENFSPLQPISLYGATKLANEVLTTGFLAESNVRSRGIRFFTVYGEMGRPDMAYFKILSSLINSAPFPLYGTGGLPRDFTYIGDAIKSLILLEQQLESTETGHSDVVNIGGGHPRTLIEMIGVIEGLVGEKLKIQELDRDIADVNLTIASSELQRELINYVPETSLEDGLEKIWLWASNSNVIDRFKKWSK